MAYCTAVVFSNFHPYCFICYAVGALVLARSSLPHCISRLVSLQNIKIGSSAITVKVCNAVYHYLGEPEYNFLLSSLVCYAVAAPANSQTKEVDYSGYMPSQPVQVISLSQLMHET